MQKTGKVKGQEDLLSPYQILDLTDEKGYVCGKILADLGADVIRIDSPGKNPQDIVSYYHNSSDVIKNLFWSAYNMNKRSITLDIETAEGRDILKKLVENADFLIESFEPGYMACLGLSYKELSQINPRLVMTSITPFGQTGPYAHYKATDIVVHAMGYLMNQCGDPDRPPVQVGVPQSFISAGSDAAVGSMVAHYYRIKTGRGQHVDVAAMDSVVMNSIEGVPEWTVGHSDFKRRGHMHKLAGKLYSPVIWECRDGYMSYFFMGGGPGARANRRLVDWMDREGMAPEHLKSMEWEKLDVEKIDQAELDHITYPIAEFFKTRTKAEIQEEAIKNLIMMYPVCDSKETLENVQLEARNFWENVNHDELNRTIAYPGAFAIFSETPIEKYIRAPIIGEHNEEIFHQELGYSRDEMEALKKSGII